MSTNIILTQRRHRPEYHEASSSPRPLNWFERLNNHYLLEDHSTNPLEYVGHRAIGLGVLMADAALLSWAATLAPAAAVAACGSENLSTKVVEGDAGPSDGQGRRVDGGADAATDTGRRVFPDVIVEDGVNDAQDLPDTVVDADGDGEPDMTVADLDTEAAADDGATPIEDADGDNIPDEVDTFIAADDGTSVADDGIADDGATPIVDADGDNIPDEVDTFIAADDGTSVADDGIADDGATDAMTDEGITDATAGPDADDVPETAPEVDVGPEVTPLTLKCEAPQPEITCLVGEKNIKVPLLVQGATSVECSTPLTIIPLADPNTPTTVNVILKDCATTTVTCDAWNDKTTAVDACETAKVTAIKPNAKPEGSPKGPTGVVYPSGNQCYIPTNTIPFSALISDADKDVLTIGLTVYHNGTKIGGMNASFDYPTYIKGPVTLYLPASTLSKKAGVYEYDFTLDDGKGGVTTTAKGEFTASEKGLMALYSFDTMTGNTVLDVSGNKVNGSIVSADPVKMWKIDPTTGAKMLCFPGNGDMVTIPVPETWKELGDVTLKTRFSIDPKNSNDNFLVHWSKGIKHGLMLRLEGGFKKAIFGLCGDPKVACENTWWWWATSGNPLAPQQFHDVMGVVSMGSAKLYIDGVKAGEMIAKNTTEKPAESNITKAFLGSTITLGKLMGAAGTDYSFNGCMDDFALYDVDATQPCQ